VEDTVSAEPGTVLVIGDAGRLRACECEYDHRVAGVVSGAGGTRPGIILDQAAAEAGVPLAHGGKVFCKAVANTSPIDVGDLLTTSAVSGRAMKAVDPARYAGAILGKALGPLHQGSGLIPVLVSLH
jgi:hypothetical protein